ncbi:MAG: hypothetical protein H8F28_20310 [Fibrella sp.]|nr:hypothetical protein [Armatimonadota bacterium]
MKRIPALFLFSLFATLDSPAMAQTVFFPSATPPPRAVRAGDAAYWVGKPQVLIAADVDDLHVSPDRRYLLAICRNPQREPFGAEETGDAGNALPRFMRPRTGTVSLMVFDSHRGRVSTLWKREASADEKLILSELRWLADSKTAMATMSVITLLPEVMRQSGGKQRAFRPESVDTSLLIIAADRRTVRPVPLLAGNASNPMVQIIPSLATNRALLTIRPAHDGPSQFRFINQAGVLTEPVPAEIGFSFFSGWTEDGSKATGFAMPNSRSGWSETKNIAVDGRTGAVTLTERDPAADPKKAAKVTIPEWQESPLDKERPVQCFSEKVTITPTGLSGNTFTATPVLLRSATDPKEAVVIAPDGEPVGVLGDGENLTVLYRSNDALYGVALRKVPRTEYETAVRNLAKLRADALRSALAVWRLQHDNAFPAPGTDIALLLSPTKQPVGSTPDELFLDPLTGKSAFTYLYRGSVDGENVPLFSLSSVGGRYVSYTTGYRAHWVADGTPIPATEPKNAE